MSIKNSYGKRAVAAMVPAAAATSWGQNLNLPEEQITESILARNETAVRMYAAANRVSLTYARLIAARLIRYLGRVKSGDVITLRVEPETRNIGQVGASRITMTASTRCLRASQPIKFSARIYPGWEVPTSVTAHIDGGQPMKYGNTLLGIASPAAWANRLDNGAINAALANGAPHLMRRSWPRPANHVSA